MTELEKLPARIDGLESQIQQLGTEMRAEFSAVRADIAALDSKLDSKIDAQGVQMRVLHEEVITRIALLQEGRPAPRRRRSKG